MLESDLKYYKAIGKIYSGISLAKTYDEAITVSLKVILENSMADYGIIWYADQENHVLRPAYWICPMDLTDKCCDFGTGIVGRVFENGKNEILNDASEDNTIKAVFEDITVSSALCLPLNLEDDSFGCIEFLKSEGSFTDDGIEVCDMLTLMMQMQVKAEAPKKTPHLEEMHNKKILLSVKNVHKSFKNGETISHVLKGVNFDAYEGEFLCLLGESGSGKSTVLNIIGGLMGLDEGEVFFDGKNIAHLSQKELTKYRRDYVGFIFQAYNLMPNLNAKQNLDLIGELSSNPADSNELLSLVGLGDKADRYPSMLSGGQQQRVAIARAMIKRPKLILADEPTAALDYSTSIEVLSVMENVVKKGTTLILITHNEEIAKMADRIIRFRNGKTYEITINRRPLKATELVW